MKIDYNLSRLRVLFAIWIVFFLSFHEFTKVDPIPGITHNAELGWIQDVTSFVLQGFVFYLRSTKWGGGIS